MLRDVFYYGKKPNVHPRERFAIDIEDARSLSTSEHFWIVNEFCDYTNFDWDFDFEFLPDEDVWAEAHNNVWPSQHQKDSGTWLCPKEHSDIIVYRADVDPVKRRNELTDNWILLENIDIAKFDFSWHPDPTDPPYIYKWGCKFFPAQIKPCLEYHVPNATEIKYMDAIVELLPNQEYITILQRINTNAWDMSWRPDPMDPPYIYVWGNKWIPGEIQATLEYHVPGATEKKYMPELVEVLPEWDNWKEYQAVDKTKFDFSWRPDPREPAYIYVWGNKWIPGEIQATLEYHVPGATEKKYMPELVAVLPEQDKWKKHQSVYNFDFSWRPDPREPAYIYVWGNKWVSGEVQSTLEYYTPGATEKKYMPELVAVLPEWYKWKEHYSVDKTKFDFSWRPDPTSPPYIYVWGNKWVSGEIHPTLEYHVPGAMNKKFMPELIGLLPLWNKWKEYYSVDKTKFDFSWIPDPTSPPYIYVWGNKWIPGETHPTLEYHVPGATEKKYMPELVEVLPEWDKWKEHYSVDKTKFDFSWRPDPTSPPYIYVWGNKWIPGEVHPTLEYHVPGATEKKYMPELVSVLPAKNKWNILIPVDESSFDFSWMPDPTSPPYVYVWGNKWIPGEIQATLEYHVPGATENKYMPELVEVLPEQDKWKILIPIDESSFDFTWRPDPTSPPYIYVWGNQSYSAEKEPTIEYYCTGATDRKYMTDMVAKTLPIHENWKTMIPVESFDYSWRPDPYSPPYIYVFGNMYNDAMTEPTVEFHVPGATDRKYIIDIVAKPSPLIQNWKTLIPVEDFDYHWRPNPHSPPYIYVFGNQWYDATLEPTVEYHAPGATDKKYITDIVAEIKPNMANWTVPFEIDGFDYSWHPHPHNPPMIYQFGTLLEDIHLKDGPVYTVPGNDGTVVYLENSVANKKKISYPKYYINSTLEDLIKDHPDEIFWALRKNINYDNFNFDWRPTKENVFHINVFGSPESEITQTYFVNTRMIKEGHSKMNFIENKKIDDEYLSTLFKPMDMFFVDRGNKESIDRFEQLKNKFPNIQKTRFLNTWVDTITRCLNKCSTELCWILNSELDYTEFDFNYYPNPWQMKMVHVFGTQWNHWGTTFVVNKESFPNDTKYVKIIEHLPNINFVKKLKAKATNYLYDVYFIDHGNDESDSIKESLENKNLTVHTIPYVNDYLTTFKNILEDIPIRKDHYIWVCSSLCKYDNFDFSYICDPFSLEQLHVFPSDKQKFGDTFFINVNKFRTLVNELTKLSDLEKINFNNTFRLQRLPAPIIVTDSDTHTDFAKHQYNFPYAVYLTNDNKNMMVRDDEPMSLWSEDSKNIIVTSEGASRVIIPKEASKYVKSELYDYPYISKSNRLRQSIPMDVVFLSNGEKCADENFEHLQRVVRGSSNRITRVDGVNGRVQAYHAAAAASSTPWLLTVFAKLKVNEKFNWAWQPDRLQVPKHYVFYATNPVNGLEYGHQAMIAYNKKLVLANTGKGLDFTMDDEHEVVEFNSGVAMFNTDPFSTWRTAFREVIKLRVEDSQIGNLRMEKWLTGSNGEFGEYSIKGAKDALDYYTEVNGDLTKLKLSYEWNWLKEYFNSKY